MKCLNLLDIDLEIDQTVFDHLVRVDNLFIGSKVDSEKHIELIKSLNVSIAIDLKGSDETNFNDQEEFEKNNIKYFHFPITDMNELDFQKLQEFGKLFTQKTEKILIYCGSGNRVGALLTLFTSLVCGHPKNRAYEFGVKIGMNREPTQKLISEILERGSF